jgi:hypothetical protein
MRLRTEDGRDGRRLLAVLFLALAAVSHAAGPENALRSTQRAGGSATAANAERFGTTMEQAAQLRERSIDGPVDYAVVNEAGEVLSAAGGIPLTMEARTLTDTLGGLGITPLQGRDFHEPLPLNRMKGSPLLRVHAALHRDQVLHGDLPVRDRPFVLLPSRRLFRIDQALSHRL